MSEYFSEPIYGIAPFISRWKDVKSIFLEEQEEGTKINPFGCIFNKLELYLFILIFEVTHIKLIIQHL